MTFVPGTARCSSALCLSICVFFKYKIVAGIQQAQRQAATDQPRHINTVNSVPRVAFFPHDAHNTHLVLVHWQKKPTLTFKLIAQMARLYY